jgi:flagellar motor switch protein FliG
MSEQIKNAVRRQMSGAERAAVVLHELGEDVAAAVLRQMDEGAIGRISGAMASFRNIPPEDREEVLDAFESDFVSGGGTVEGFSYISKVLVSALGEPQAREILDRLSRNGRQGGGASPMNADPRTLAVQMANERPQTLALLLAQIPNDTGAAMLSFLPEELATEAIYRFTTLEAVSPGAVTEMRLMMTELLANSANGGRRLDNLGGAKKAAEILNRLQSSMSERVLDAIETRDSATAVKIRENLFTFLDLVKLPDRTLQILLREVPTNRLAPALRLVDETVRARFFQNLSARTVEILKEELTSGPPMRRNDVLEAQSEIVEIALKLAAEGRISINPSEELV